MAKGKRIEIQTLERAAHEDVLRGDAFTMASTLEIMRGLYNDKRLPLTFPGTALRASGSEPVVRANVLSGLRVGPDHAAYLTVDAGQVLFPMAPSDSDDSLLELVDDPGVNTAGTLPFVANAAGSVRLDIVEASVTDTTLETVTRGIFDTITRVFLPTSVPKVKAPRLSYRIRQGVAGGGLPAAVAGWLPLAVVCHQPGTASFVDCDLWDVRPLISEQVQFGESQFGVDGVTPSKVENTVEGRWRSTVTSALQGYAISQFDGYRAGGQLRANTALPLAERGNGSSSVSLNYVQSHSPGFSAVPDAILHVAALFPGGLPRWVKYADFPAPYGMTTRLPYGPNGILVVTNTQPKSNGRYDALSLPAACGFTATAPGVALVSLAWNHSNNYGSGSRVGNKISFGDSRALLPGITGVGTPAVRWLFSANAGVVIPAQARSIDVQFNYTAVDDGQFIVAASKQVSEEAHWVYNYPSSGAAGGTQVTVRDIPLAISTPWDADTGGLPAQSSIILVGQGNITACTAYVVGYST